MFQHFVTCRLCFMAFPCTTVFQLIVQLNFKSNWNNTEPPLSNIAVVFCVLTLVCIEISSCFWNLQFNSLFLQCIKNAFLSVPTDTTRCTVVWHVGFLQKNTRVLRILSCCNLSEILNCNTMKTKNTFSTTSKLFHPKLLGILCLYFSRFQHCLF